MCVPSETHQEREKQLQTMCEALQSELASVRKASSQQMAELEGNQRQLQEERDRAHEKCELFKGESKSLLSDFQEQVEKNQELEREKDMLSQQVEGARRELGVRHERVRQLEEELRKRERVEGQELVQARERLERLETQRNELQSREELMDLQVGGGEGREGRRRRGGEGEERERKEGGGDKREIKVAIVSHYISITSLCVGWLLS